MKNKVKWAKIVPLPFTLVLDRASCKSLTLKYIQMVLRKVSNNSLREIKQGWQTIPQAKSNQWLGNKVLLEHSYVHSFTYYLWLPLYYNSRATVTKIAHKLKNILTIWPFASPSVQNDSPSFPYSK
jgi:predicted Zn-dependent protease